MNPPEQQRTAIAAAAAPLLRRWWWLWAFLVIGIAAAVVLVTTADEETLYKAEALVVATELEIRVDALPGTATAIFEGGTVADIAAARAGTGVDPDDLIPEIVDVDPVVNTSVVEVDGFHRDPELAARYANVAAEALVEELNRVGPGLGVFAVHAPASVPDTPVPNSNLERIAGGLIIGVVFVSGLIALISMVVTWRRGRHSTVSERAAPSSSGPTETVAGIGPIYSKRLAELGVHELTDLVDADPQWLSSAMDIRTELAADWIGQAKSLLNR